MSVCLRGSACVLCGQEPVLLTPAHALPRVCPCMCVHSCSFHVCVALSLLPYSPLSPSPSPPSVSFCKSAT